MINSNLEKFYYLVPSKAIGSKTYEASIKIIELFKDNLPKGHNPRNHAISAFLREIQYQNIRFLKSWSYTELDKVCKSVIQGGEVDIDLYNANNTKALFIPSTDKGEKGFKLFLRFLALHLWAEKAVLLPWQFVAPVNVDKTYDDFVEAAGSSVLKLIRGMRETSRFENRAVGEYKNLREQCGKWQRLLFMTDFVDEKNITEEAVFEILSCTRGREKTLKIQGISTLSLLQEISSNLEQIRPTLSPIFGLVEERDELKREASRQKAIEKKRRKSGKRYVQKYVSKVDTYRNEVAHYTLDHDDPEKNLELLFQNIHPQTIKAVLLLDSVVWEQSPPKARTFCEMVHEVFDAWIDSEQQQRPNTHIFCKNLLISYLLIYLPAFFVKRDGDLKNYPTSFNDFSCPYFVSRNDRLTKLVSREKEAPITLIQYLNFYSDQFQWESDTLYARLLKFDGFFNWIVDNTFLLPDSEKFSNTISSENYPKTSRKSHTVKKPIPSRYFGSLISFCYSLEYMLDHINGMVYDYKPSYLKDSEYAHLEYTPVFYDGEKYVSVNRNPGRIEQKLIHTSLDEMEVSSVWKGLWGRIGSWAKEDIIAIERLNYTPIFYFEDKAYPIQRCQRFYSFCNYQTDVFDGRVIAPHPIRILLLMCETGIRQQHIKWLDVNTFDCRVDDSCRVELEPLLVNTDKSHDQWISIVNHRVIDLCRNQKEWLNANQIEGIHEPVWYGNTLGSKFGKFNPLFRHTVKDVHTSVDEAWTFILFSFQNFIKFQLEDIELPDLVRYMEKGSSVKDFDRLGMSVYSPFDLDDSKSYSCRVRHTPHALRATFVSERMTYLPPSIIGANMTGQTEYQVHYYNVVDTTKRQNHSELLEEALKESLESADTGVPPQIARMASEIHAKMKIDIEDDPVEAIATHGLISLSNIEQDKTGIEILKAKKHTQLAFNDTHICPFNNVCPQEIIRDYGAGRPCSMCPYALRGSCHLPAISATKDRARELMHELKKTIQKFKKRKNSNKVELEKIMEEYDVASTDAFALEFTEHQLNAMRNAGFEDGFIVGKSEELKLHFERLNIDRFDYVLKRLIDIQNFPSLDSRFVQGKFAHARKALLLKDNDIKGLLEENTEQAESDALTSQIKSMMSAKGLTVGEVFAMTKIDIDKLIEPAGDGYVTKGIQFFEAEV